MSEISAAVRAELSLLTPDQVCELLQVKKAWLYDEVEKGNIQVVRLGRQLRFLPIAIAEYVQGVRPIKAPEPEPVRRGRPRKA